MSGVVNIAWTLEKDLHDEKAALTMLSRLSWLSLCTRESASAVEYSVCVCMHVCVSERRGVGLEVDMIIEMSQLVWDWEEECVVGGRDTAAILSYCDGGKYCLGLKKEYRINL